MLMAFVGILSAQSGPKFNYSAVVRHHVTNVVFDDDTIPEMDTLYHNQEVDIAIAVTNGAGEKLYEEFHNGKMTDDNGLVHLVVGTGDDKFQSLVGVDWSDAKIVATISLVAVGYEMDPIITTVMPVPFALQAGIAPLTTKRIATYLKHVTADDAKRVLNALVVDNNPLQAQMEDSIEDYLASEYGYQIAKQIALFYLTQYVDENEAKDFYDAMNANEDVKAEVKELIKAFVMNEDNRETIKTWVKPVVVYCLQNTNMQDVRDFYDALQQIPASEKQEIKQVIKNYLETYMQSDAFGAVISENQTEIGLEVNEIIRSVTEEEALAAWGWLEMTRNDDLKPILRNKLNFYIDKYVGTELDTRVNNVISANTANLIEIPDSSSCDIDICTLWASYKAWKVLHP